MNEISQLNEWCQQHQYKQPDYSFTPTFGGWVCSLILYNHEFNSKAYASMKLAKREVANLCFKWITINNLIEIKPTKSTILMIDGDQRMDCINWLNGDGIKFNIIDLEPHIYLSPTTSLSKSSTSNDQFTFHISKTTNRDSADALLLMDLGALLFRQSQNKNFEQNIIIVSADHILVQAADDHKLSWANNLDRLKTLLNE